MIMKNKKEEAAAIPPPLTKDQELLIDIRELLKNK
jgi:large-conductance mechanosensitive channel